MAKTQEESGSKRRWGAPNLVVGLSLSLLGLSCSPAATGSAQPGVTQEVEPSVGPKAREREECFLACERENTKEYCADEEGNTVACPCQCP
jgi:hypothetical protein